MCISWNHRPYSFCMQPFVRCDGVSNKCANRPRGVRRQPGSAPVPYLTAYQAKYTGALFWLISNLEVNSSVGGPFNRIYFLLPGSTSDSARCDGNLGSAQLQSLVTIFTCYVYFGRWEGWSRCLFVLRGEDINKILPSHYILYTTNSISIFIVSCHFKFVLLSGMISGGISKHCGQTVPACDLWSKGYGSIPLPFAAYPRQRLSFRTW